MSDPRVLNMTPSIGYRGLWVWRNQYGDLRLQAESILGWAVCSNEADTGYVDGLVLSEDASEIITTTEYTERSSNDALFLRFLRPNESPDSYTKAAAELLAERDGRKALIAGRRKSKA